MFFIVGLKLILNVKLGFFDEYGINNSLLHKILVSSPKIVRRSIDKQLKPASELLKGYVTSPKNFEVVIRRGSLLLTCDWNNMRKNLEYLTEQGVPKHRIEDLLVLQPRVMLQHIARMKNTFKRIKDMGINPSDLRFIHAFRVMVPLSESSWKKKVEIFRSMDGLVKRLYLLLLLVHIVLLAPRTNLGMVWIILLIPLRLIER